jgi:hypothetical protein
MSERLLEALREEAELATRVPAFELIEAAGRARRRRRHAVVAAVAACMLAVAGVVTVTDDSTGDPQPADDTSRAAPYPGALMTTLAEGTYEIEPAHRSRPVARFTLPPGWNSWVGPNRFEGLSDQESDHAGANNEVLEQDPEWYLGLLFMEVEWVAQADCTMTDLKGDDTASLVRALTKVPRLKVTSGPESTVRFGHPAVHLRLEEQGGSVECLNDSLFNAAVNLGVTYLGRGTTYDAWVIDLDGRPFLVWAAWTARTPDAEVDALLNVVDSIEIRERE